MAIFDGGNGPDTYPGTEDPDVINGNGGDDTLSGAGSADAIDGGEGNDVLDGGEGVDVMTGGIGGDSYYVDNVLDQAIEIDNSGPAAPDRVYSSVDYALGAWIENLTLTGSDDIDGTGNSLDNVLTGNGGDNVLTGGGGTDDYAGGAGDDTYYLNTHFFSIGDEYGDGDQVFEAAGGGIDRIYTAGDLEFENGSSEIEFITLTGTADADVAGTSTANDITGNSGANHINSFGGSDTVHAGDGNDVLFGGAADDLLYGEGANDSIDGGTGADEMHGGAGDDDYFVDNAGDRVFEASGEGLDTVNTTVNFDAAGQEIEKIRLTGDNNLKAWGNDLANVLTGNSGKNVLTGRGGNDTYYIQTVGDKVVEQAGEGTDTVYTDISFTLSDNVENLMAHTNAALTLTGNALDNRIEGLGGHDVIDGMGGADRMYGHAGNDTYYVDDAGDKAFESADEGQDIVFASVSYSLAGQNVEDLTLTGTAAINGTANSLANVLTGNSGVNILRGAGGDDTYYVQTAGDQVIEASGEGTDTVFASISFDLAGQYAENLTLTGAGDLNGYGNDLANVINGTAGNNWLDGRGGGDTLTGGAGNDTYVVDSASDTLVELAGEGTDTVMAGVTWQLGANFENLTLTGAGAIDGIGNAGNNVITGNDGVNQLRGGAGNDTYYVQTAGDKVLENVGEGTDSIFSSVTYSLAGQQVENLTLTGSANLNATGNTLANVLTGNSGANVVRASDGNDSLYGKLGNDRLNGGAGADHFHFDTALGAGNVDTIEDFNVVDDTIFLDRAIFPAFLGDGTISASAFGHVGDPETPDARILYDSTTGALSYDADGAGAGSAVQFATVAPGTMLTYDDFVAYS